MVVYRWNYCEQFCKNVYLFGTMWDIRCDRTGLIQNKEYHEKYKQNNMTALTCTYAKDCLQYQFAKSVAIEIKAKIEEGDEGFMRFLEKVNNRPKRTIGTKQHPISDFLEVLLKYKL